MLRKGKDMGKPLKNILVIDDDEEMQEAARLGLEMLGGFEVHTCGDGEEGIRMAASLQPDLLLLDSVMPGMDGPSMLRQMREREELSEIPVIFVTSMSHDRERREFETMGALGVIEKPFDPKGLPDRVRSIWKARESR